MNELKQRIIEGLQTVLDPEIGIDIWTMGLIYGIDLRDQKNVYIKMTLTSPTCPLGPLIEDNIKKQLGEIGFDNIEIEFTFDPPWQAPDRLKAALGFGSV